MSIHPTSSFLTSLASIIYLLNLTVKAVNSWLQQIHNKAWHMDWGQEMTKSAEAQNQKYLQTLLNLDVLAVGHLLTSAWSRGKKWASEWMCRVCLSSAHGRQCQVTGSSVLLVKELHLSQKWIVNFIIHTIVASGLTMHGNLCEPQFMMNGQWPNGLMPAQIISAADDLKQLHF